MPIRRELLHLYGRQWRMVTRPRILARAGDKCEVCRVPNRKTIVRHPRTYPGWWFEIDTGAAYDESGTPKGIMRETDIPSDFKVTTIVLTVAHLNHVAGQDDDDNLKALCQRCHLKYDREKHKETRATRKDASRPLLAAIIKGANL